MSKTKSHRRAIPSNPPQPQRAELSYDEALRLAIAMHQDRRVLAAEKLYRKLVEVRPDDPNPLHFLGVLLHQDGKSEEALAMIDRSLEMDPGVASWHNNRGNVLLMLQRADDARAAYERCRELEPANPAVANNLGCLLRAMGEVDAAEALFRELLAREPAFADAHTNFANLLVETRRVQEAMHHFGTSLELRPDDPKANRMMGMIFAHSGQPEKAAQAFERWIAAEPDNPQPRHHLAAVTGRNAPERASDDYVSKLFDSFSLSFDERLAFLEYRAPSLVAELLQRLAPEARGDLAVLDAGCGTGLCAPFLAPYARELIGVDLSGGMLDKARERGGYHELVKAELVGYLQHHPARFDLIVSADTLCYFGRIDAAMKAAAQALRPGGRLIFTVEALSGEVPEPAGYRLQLHGRYAHERAYVEACLAEAGLQVSAVESVVLRQEVGEPVSGWLVGAQRPAA
ncbi:tetratricopeptide repeat protein [Roseateles saccharophilus]|uniref:Putative TPR repeat methyltransferase n=1 Tax=Roseateles saccharophilus TaxID=304 RepID=A0A4R3UVU9_ROSSA|nr:tetratricopeptide repeat protein [Roseateles saccharophilus]MDG0833096.1 tetratricopeptide repeat protein [Roseateles saccharophilus]TCU96295.1 putative TPR repeat methyltransferase [Roseateles saccharophilus]